MYAGTPITISKKNTKNVLTENLFNTASDEIIYFDVKTMIFQ